MNRDHSDIVKDLIDRDVYCCQSLLVDKMIQAGFSGESGAQIDIDDINNLYVSSDEEAQDYGYDSLEAAEEDGCSKEVFEWYVVSKWLANKIEELRGVVIRSPYGIWWGREETGQSLKLDYMLNKVVEKYMAA